MQFGGGGRRRLGEAGLGECATDVGRHLFVVLFLLRIAGLRGEPAELGPGDYICYPGDLKHVFEALESRTLAVLVSEHT